MDVISEVSEELAYFILSNKKVNLPGVGCFKAVYQSAKLDPKSHMLSAPSENIVFSNTFDEDSSFVDYLKSEYDNQDIYSNFKEAIQNGFEKLPVVELPGLGKFTKNIIGGLSFEYDEQDTFQFESIELHPVVSITETNQTVARNVPGAATKSNPERDTGFPLISLGLIATILAFCIAVYFNQDINTIKDGVVKKVNTSNINVSPKDIKEEIFIASVDDDEMGKALKEDVKEEIIDRQKAMTFAAAEDPKTKEARIITNTFGSSTNVEKQIGLIESLGYQSAKREKENGLTSTILILEYEDEAQLDSLMEKVKINFPRAKLRK